MKNRPLNPLALGLKDSGIKQFFEIASQVPGLISLGVGEPDFDTPWHVREEAMYRIRQGQTFYLPSSGLFELRDKISDWVLHKTGVKYDPREEVLVTVGASQAIDLALRAICSLGDEVILCEPAYVSYEPCILLNGAKVVRIQLEASDDFKLKKDQLKKALSPRTKALIINYPNNPTGAVMDKKDLADLVDVVVDHNLIVLSDEIYDDLSYTDQGHVSLISFPKMKDHVLYINGFSKAFAMTGWRMGYLCGPRWLMDPIQKINQMTLMCAPTLSQYAALEALDHPLHDIESMRQSYNQRRRYVLSRFEEMGLPCFEPQGAFYTFPDISEFKMTSYDFCMDLIDKEKVALIPGSAFGQPGEGFVRVSYAYSLQELQEALDRLAHYLDQKRRSI